MRVLDQGFVFDAARAPVHRRFCSFTNALIMSDGRILVTFRTGSSKDAADENVMTLLSSDGGKTWQTVFEGLEQTVDGVASGWRYAGLAEVEPGRLVGAFCCFDRSDPRRPFTTNPETTGLLPARIFVMDSPDCGRTWLNRREVDTRPFAGIAPTGAILKLLNGDLALPYETWKGYYDTAPGQHRAVLRLSHDGAASFEPAVTVAHDPSGDRLFWDQRLAVDGRTGALIGLFWTYSTVLQRDVNVHVGWGSLDGRRWTEPVDTGICGQIAAPAVLPDGRVFVAYVRRHEPRGLYAILSKDFGEHWDSDGQVRLHTPQPAAEDIRANEQSLGEYIGEMSRWNFGHPDVSLLPGGDILVAFYAGNASAMSIHWMRVAV